MKLGDAAKGEGSKALLHAHGSYFYYNYDYYLLAPPCTKVKKIFDRERERERLRERDFFWNEYGLGSSVPTVICVE